MSVGITPLTSYYGGKSMLLGKLFAERIDQIPHSIYVETHGGMFGVGLQKQPSAVEVYNDLSKGLYTLFRVVTSPQDCQELERRLKLTLYSRMEWEFCMRSYQAGGDWSTLSDPIEQARRVYVMLDQSFSGLLTNNGWSFGGPSRRRNVASQFYNGLDKIPAVMKRLRTVQIECHDALAVISRWDTQDTLFYVDPPYMWETRRKTTTAKGRKQSDYEHEMNNEQHQRLLEVLLAASGKVLLSGYATPTYDEPLIAAGWIRESYQSQSVSSMQSVGKGMKGYDQELSKRTECLWISPNAQIKTLWN